MKILYVHNEYSRPSGEEHASRSICEMLADYGHEVVWFKRSSAEIADSKLGKLKAFVAGICNPFAAKELAKVLDEVKPDIVQVQNIYPLLSPAIFRPIKKRGIPIVMRCPNYRLFCPNGLCFDEKGQVCEKCFGYGKELWCIRKNCLGSRFKTLGYAVRNFAARITRRILDNVDIFIVQTKFQKQKFIEQGIQAEKIGILAGITPLFEEPENYDLGDAITFVGRVSPEKGIDEFIEAARQLPDIPFVVAGSYAGMPGIDNDSPVNLTWAGFLSGNDLRDAYLNSRIIAVPSKCYEGFPNVIVLGMVLKRPIIAANLGSMCSIVDHEQNGLLFEPGNTDDFVAKIKDLYYDNDRCKAMGMNGEQKAGELYSREAIYNALMDIYQRAKEKS
jgi:glycosyltransferase involved in cell wall biosynthesis